MLDVDVSRTKTEKHKIIFFLLQNKKEVKFRNVLKQTTEVVNTDSVTYLRANI